MSGAARGILKGAETLFLHMGPARSAFGDQGPLGDRLQVMADPAKGLVVSDVRSLASRFHLGDLLEVAEARRDDADFLRYVAAVAAAVRAQQM